jgi:NAD(P)-dependent dehydrogenase (short-subunit alcohol dehydrogenase family)
MANEDEGPRTAIVTGGARRIGAALCRALAADGWHLLIHCGGSEREAAALAAELGNSKSVSADLADPNAAAAIIGALDGLPPARLLVNNAARFAYDAADDFTAAQWDEHQAVNVRAPALLSQAFVKAIGVKAIGAETVGPRAAAGHGLIVNLLDAKLLEPNPDFFSYTVSKMALAGLTELQARAYGPRRIRVCGIAPAVTLRSGAQTAANFEAVHALNPIGRGVTTEDIVEALRFIVRSPTLTGQIITLDGGQRFLGLARDVQFLEQH